MQACTMQQLLCPAAKDGKSAEPPLSEEAAQQLSNQRLAAVADICVHSVQPGTQQRRQDIMTELNDDMKMLPPQWGKSPMTATPEDVASFLAGSWLPRHGGTLLPDGSTQAAPQSVANAASNLAAGFDSLGRSGMWQPATQQGNPCRSSLMHTFVQGYGKKLFVQGYAEKAAPPLTRQSAAQALQKLATSAASMPLGSLPQCMAFRQGGEVSLLMASALRGADVGKLQIQDVRTAGGQPLVPFLEGVGKLQTGDTFLVQPYGLKNRQEANAGSVPCIVPAEAALNFCLWLLCLAKSSRRLGQPLQQHIFRPLESTHGHVFAEKPLSSNCLARSAAGADGRRRHGWPHHAQHTAWCSAACCPRGGQHGAAVGQGAHLVGGGHEAQVSGF